MQIGTSNVAEPVRPADVVGSDHPCYRCGYNVRGLAVGGRCPECSAAIRESIWRRHEALAGRTLPLEGADPTWLRTLARGCGLILLGALIRIGTELLSIWPTPFIPAALRIVIFLVPYVLLAAGIWLAAAPERDLAAPTRGQWLPVLIRAAMICWLLAVFSFGILRWSWFDVRMQLEVALSGLLAWCVFWRFRGIIARGRRVSSAHRIAVMAWLVASVCGAWCWGMHHSISELYSVPTSPSSSSVYVPIPVVGPCPLVVKLPHSIVTFPRQADVTMFAMAVMTATPLLAMVTLAGIRRTLRGAARRPREDSTA